MLEFELIVPAYNEAATLKALIERAKAAAVSHGLDASKFQLVIVQNGSTDDSATVLSNLSASELGSWFRVVTVPINQGYGFGLHSGLKASTAPYLAYSHADMQCDPNDSFTALAMLRESENLLVKGRRSGRSKRDIFVSRVFELLAWVILGLRVYEMNAQPKAFPRALLSALTDPPKTFAFDLYLLYHARKLNYRFHEIEVSFPPRIHGVSKWAATFFGRYKTILGMIRYMLQLRLKEGKA